LIGGAVNSAPTRAVYPSRHHAGEVVQCSLGKKDRASFPLAAGGSSAAQEAAPAGHSAATL